MDSTPSVEQDQHHPEIQRLLSKFCQILEEPLGLPPKSAFDHCIMLKEEMQSINVHPYNYAHFQKEEIECQVREMLEKGLIRLCLSPFSLPILLVKKKDGTWHFCTDYRASNAITMKDIFLYRSMMTCWMS